ncbi:MAG: glutamine--tRNA ligase/YqeY domain fusion protein [Fibrobacter sp.]|nr:glutamine--tRNA ligase/YqeY domain fusion protein [Fibrobacter sp.]
MSLSIPSPANFIEDIIVEDLKSGKRTNVHTRFPPEPNGYLHIGHAKSICLNFGIAHKFADFNGLCNVRMDDTNPAKEDIEYEDSIKADVRWLGFDWEDREYYASDYYQKFYDYAIDLIKMGKAYVCELTAEQMTEYRGTLTEAGRNSPWRDRPIEESLDLFARMTAGEFPEGKMLLRAKIDMSSPNINMRDPAIYRIRKIPHHRIGDKWVVYPMYDYAHPLSDWIEGITHSICTLEFEDHRPLYNWFLETLELPNRPQQIEFARLNLSYTVMSKRLLLQLVEAKFVDGWDDPRLPTISGLRRRGYTPASIREFADRIGVAKADSIVDINLLWFCIRDELNATAPRAMAVLDPLKVKITNWPEGKVEMVQAQINPNDPEAGFREVPFSGELWIERSDFMEDPPKKYFRLAPGQEVRLISGYYVTCTDVIKDDEGNVVEIHCTYDPESKGGTTPDGRRVRGTIHWVSAAHAVDAKVNLYEHLFTRENMTNLPPDTKPMDFINENSLEVSSAKVEPYLQSIDAETRVQFMRHGYFWPDKESSSDALVFNRIVGLKDSWGKKKK